MSKYPHLSNVLNRKFDDVSKFEIEGLESQQAQGLEAVVEQLKKLIELQAKEVKAKEEERKKLEQQVKEEEAKERAKTNPTGTGFSDKELEREKEESKNRIEVFQNRMKDLDEKFPSPKSKTERFKNFMEQNRLESEKRKVFGKDKRPKKNTEEEKRKNKEKREKLVARINRNKKMKEQNDKGVSNLIDRMTENQKKPNVNNNAGENLTNLYNKRFGSKRVKKSEDNEFDWFSAVRV